MISVILITSDGRKIGYADVPKPSPKVITLKQATARTFIRETFTQSGFLVYRESSFDWAENFRMEEK